MIRQLKSSKNREDNPMYSGIVRTVLTNGLPLELDCREPREVRPDARAQEWAVNSEEYFARIQAVFANDFKRLLNQI
jgi:hypothetical protein